MSLLKGHLEQQNSSSKASTANSAQKVLVGRFSSFPSFHGLKLGHNRPIPVPLTTSQAPKTPSLPYEPQQKIVSFLSSGKLYIRDNLQRRTAYKKCLLSLCRVSKSWNAVASEFLYETVAPMSYRSAELLLRSLNKDQESRYRGLIKKVHFPLKSSLSPPRSGYTLDTPIFDDDGIIVLGVTGTSGWSEKLSARDLQILSQIFSSIIRLCPKVEEIRLPILTKPSTRSPATSIPFAARNLCRLLLSGPTALSILINDILLSSNRSAFTNLEAVSLYAAEAGNIDQTLNTMLERKENDDIFLPKIRSLHIMGGLMGQEHLFTLLILLQKHLSTLTLQDLLIRVIGPLSFHTADSRPPLPEFQKLLVDNITLSLLASSDIMRAYSPWFTTLTTLEVRLGCLGSKDGSDSNCISRKMASLMEGIPWNKVPALPSLKRITLILFVARSLGDSMDKFLDSKEPVKLRRIISRNAPEIGRLPLFIHPRYFY